MMALLGFNASGADLKIVRPYPVGMMSDIMAWSMAEEDGWLYIAGDDGLVQYNGAEPDLFPLNNHRPVRSVKIDSHRELIYVGGVNEFGFFKPSPTTSLEYVCLSDSIGDDRHIGNIWEIYPTRSGVLAQADNSILSFNVSTGEYKLIQSPAKLESSALIDDLLWLGTDNGLKILAGAEFMEVSGTEELKGKKIRKILAHGQDVIIVTTDSVWKYSGGRLTRLTSLDKAVAELKEIFSATLRDDILVLGSVAHGLAVIDINSGDFDIYDEKSGLSSNTVISLLFDDKGNLWTGLQYGISRVLLTEPVTSIDNSYYPIGSGYTLAQFGDKLYLGTNRGLFTTDFFASTNKIGKEIERVPDLRSQVWGLTLHDGKIFAALDQGLFVIDHPGAKPRQISSLTGVWDTRAMLQHPHIMYVGTYSGLHLLKKHNGQWEYAAQIDGYPNSAFNFVQESPLIVWINNAEDGVARITVDTITHRVKEIQNFTAAEDGYPLDADINISRIDNTIYFSTEEGVYKYDPKRSDIVRDREMNSLIGATGEVRRIKKVNGSLFALTSSALIEADPAGILDPKKMALSPSASRPNSFSDVFFPVGNNSIGYPVRTGFLIFDVSRHGLLEQKPKNLPSFIRRVSLPMAGDSVVYAGNLKKLKKEIVLPYNLNSIKIEYGRIEDIEQGVAYSTRLSHAPWSTPGKSLQREITDLDPGKYTFEVKAISLDGTENIDSVTFRVLPPWWRSNWMMLIYFLVSIALFLIIARLLQIRVRSRHMKLMEEKDLEMAAQKLLHQKESEDKDRHIHELEKEQLDRDLKHKAQEMANAMLSLTHKNEALLFVKKELQNVMSLLPHSNQEARKAISSLQQHVVVDIKSDEILKRVEEEFDIVHDNFMKKLRSRYTDLNNNEILLCAYIRMNLATKEVAPLMNLSVRGVETIRYRLRKKLGLGREESLSAFIANFQ